MPSPEHGGNWGLFGGAFDPVHNGHLNLAREILRVKQYTGILFVPSYNPPRKRGGCVASFEDRVAMLQIALLDTPNFQISEIERESDAPGYTLLTVRAIKKRFPKATFEFIIGADLLGELPGWYETDEILKEIRIVAGSRPGSESKIPIGFPEGSIEVLATSLVDLASSDIRTRLPHDLPREELLAMVAPAVADYIASHGLYL
jgi:nicotinate-nucleotide adenylyltransferase